MLGLAQASKRCHWFFTSTTNLPSISPISQHSFYTLFAIILQSQSQCMEASSLPRPPSPPAQQEQPATSCDATPPLHQDVEPCIICLQPISERAITVPCNHYTFDFICLASWLNERPKCPLCNVDVFEVQYDWASPDDFKRYSVPSTPFSSTRPMNNSRRGIGPPFRGRSRFSDLRRARHHQDRRAATPTENVAILQRRHVYRHQLYSLHVGSNRVSQYRNITPQLIASTPDLQSRARNWIRRELRVFTYLQPTSNTPTSASSDRGTGRSRQASNTEFLLEYIVAILKTVDIKGSGGQAEDMLAEFLGREDARLFLHELNAWLRSPFVNLRDWDRNVQYREELPMEFSGHEMVAHASDRRGRGGKRVRSSERRTTATEWW